MTRFNFEGFWYARSTPDMYALWLTWTMLPARTTLRQLVAYVPRPKPWPTRMGVDWMVQSSTCHVRIEGIGGAFFAYDSNDQTDKDYSGMPGLVDLSSL